MSSIANQTGFECRVPLEMLGLQSHEILLQSGPAQCRQCSTCKDPPTLTGKSGKNALIFLCQFTGRLADSFSGSGLGWIRDACSRTTAARKAQRCPRGQLSKE